MTSQTARYASPVVVSRFDSRMHAAYEQLCAFSTQSCAHSLDKLAAGEEVARNGAFAACGGSYVVSVYPDGDLERLKVVADCYSAWVFIDDYLALRATNSAMGVMYLMLAYAVPGLTEPLVRLQVAAPDVMRRVFRHSGVAVGIVLDLYKINGAHAQICDYTNLAHVVRRAASPPLALPEAGGRCIDLFHHHEDLLAAALRDVAAFSPLLARAMEHLHAGSVLWLAKMRGGRYVGLVN